MMSSRAQAYNFRRPDRISKNQVRSLHFVHDRFARNWSSACSALLRTVVELNLEGIEQIPYSEFLNTIPDPTCYVGINVKPLDGIAVLDIGPDVAFPIVERLLGGSGKPCNLGRPMTEIEQMVIRNVLKIFVDNLQDAWKAVYGLEFVLGNIESHPHMLQVAGGNDMMIHFKFQLRLRESTSAVNLGIPTLMIEPVLHVFDQDSPSRKKVVSDTGLLLHATKIPLSVTIETRDTEMPMQQLLSLRVGDVLVLEQRQDQPLVIKVGGKPKLLAEARIEASRKAFSVTQPVR